MRERFEALVIETALGMQNPQVLPKLLLKRKSYCEQTRIPSPPQSLFWVKGPWGRVGSQAVTRKERSSSDVCPAALKPASLFVGHLAVWG